ncbi:MAG: OB-fold nucleic acid binding domain-containing protein, partial [Planctomycetota bacterium]|nr:OB-fold nucleic acid binding domain-containing protein [Planctomycetota bacterium]
MTDLAHPDRLRKLEAMRAEGVDPYPPRGVASQPIETVLAGAGTPEDPGPGIGQTVTIAGRLLGLRDFGKLIFAPVLDRTGRLQIGLQKTRLGDWWPRRKWLDAADLVGVTGELAFTQKGEPTIWVDEIQLLSKAVAPPPEKWHGLTDVEAQSIEAVLAGAGTPDEPGPAIGQTVTIAGRLLGLRDFGKLIFAPVVDRTGRLQVGLQKG